MQNILKPILFRGKGRCGECLRPTLDSEPGIKVLQDGILMFKCYDCALNHIGKIKKRMYDIEEFLINGKGVQWVRSIRRKRAAGAACVNRISTDGALSIREKNCQNGSVLKALN